MQFQVLAGEHIQNGPDGKEKKYKRGEVVESKTDLAVRFNGRMGRKFERLHEDGAPSQRPQDTEELATWDRTKETLEEFTSRMRALKPVKGAPVPALAQQVKGPSK